MVDGCHDVVNRHACDFGPQPVAIICQTSGLEEQSLPKLTAEKAHSLEASSVKFTTLSYCSIRHSIPTRMAQGTLDPRQSFDWERSTFGLDSENEPWAEQVLLEGAEDTPLNLLLDIPVHSPRTYYQLERFFAVGIDAALVDMRAGQFGNSRESSLWFHDSNKNQPRSYNGVISTQKVNDVLKQKRFGNETEPDACIRRLHLFHPTSESIGVLILNLKPTERSVLRDFFWKHIKDEMNQNSIRFDIGTGGRIFSLAFHLSSFVLRIVDLEVAPNDDPRKTTDGKPWRKSRKLSFLCTEQQAILYETRHSFALYGFNKSVWTSIFLGDTYYYNKDPENQDTVDFYTEDDDDEQSEEHSVKWDPSTIGEVEAGKEWPHVCDYFLGVLLKRFNQIHEEWAYTLFIIQKQILIHVDTPRTMVELMPVSYDSVLRAMQHIQKDHAWFGETDKLLELLIHMLRAIIASWNAFRDDGWAYFPTSHRIQSTFRQLVNKIKDLEEVLNDFHDLKDRCIQFGKKLKRDTGFQAGFFSSIQPFNITFGQLMTPVALSAAITQTQIISFIAPWVCFLFVGFGLFALHWHIEPSTNPWPRWGASMRIAYNRVWEDNDPEDTGWSCPEPWRPWWLNRSANRWPAQESAMLDGRQPYSRRPYTEFQGQPLSSPHPVYTS
ncbi:hypothetical protein BGZ63DRAFT_459923 [Mariannaea sp. PMI_226]|nr:hypothetical protein BGZ63DRAFT_459923 [Mariannaea sp. PMI_226]